jgi:hypothetical protein
MAIPNRPDMPILCKNIPRRLFTAGRFFLLIFSLLPAGCVGYTPPPPTTTPSPTRTRLSATTPAPTFTITPADTPTIQPSPTPEPEVIQQEATSVSAEMIMRLGEAMQVGEGGFSFRPVLGYKVDVLPGQATLVSEDGGIVLSLVGGDVSGGSSLEGVMDRLLARVSQDFEKFETGEPYPILIDENEGLAIDVTAELVGKPVEGQVAVVAPTSAQLFYAFAFTLEELNEDRWESEGSEVFDAVVGSVHFNEMPSEGSP